MFWAGALRVPSSLARISSLPGSSESCFTCAASSVWFSSWPALTEACSFFFRNATIALATSAGSPSPATRAVGPERTDSSWVQPLSSSALAR